MISTAVQNDAVVEWDQPGEDTIGAVFKVYRTSPAGAGRSQLHKYNITRDGIMVINACAPVYQFGTPTNPSFASAVPNPVFLYYRKACPEYTGDTFDAALTYAVDDQIYFVDSNSVGNFYKCIVATSAGESPETTPASWDLIEIFDTFFQYCVYRAFADWLVSDGQQEKAVGMYAVAQEKMNDEFDVIERQMGDVAFPTRMQTHVSAQARL